MIVGITAREALRSDVNRYSTFICKTRTTQSYGWYFLPEHISVET